MKGVDRAIFDSAERLGLEVRVRVISDPDRLYWDYEPPEDDDDPMDVDENDDRDADQTGHERSYVETTQSSVVTYPPEPLNVGKADPDRELNV